MKIENILSLPSILLSIVVIGTIILWFLKKEYKSKTWFPILKIIRSKEWIIMRLSRDVPKIVPFICFVGIGSIVLFLSLSPYIEKKIYDKKSKNIYVVLDLSASIESVLDISEYKKIIKNTLVSSLDKTNKVFLYTSLGKNYEISLDNIDIILDGIISYQRSGIKLGNMIRNIPLEDGVVLIISDNDAFSWSDFDIESFSKKMIVKKVKISNEDKPKGNNFFIKDVSLIDKTNIYLSFKVNIETSFPLLQEKKGRIDVLYNNKVIKSLEWNFSSGKTSISLDVLIDTSYIKNSRIPLEFKLKLDDTDKSLNSIELDDSYRLYSDSYYQALIVSHTQGERSVDDYFFFIQKSLESLAIHPKRVSSLNEMDISKYFLLVLESNEDILEFCPNKDQIRKDQFIWIQPSIKAFFSKNSDHIYKNICRCIAYLTDDSITSINTEPKYCSNVVSNDSLSEYLKYSGATQVGGNTGEDSGIGWLIKKSIKDKNIDRDIDIDIGKDSSEDKVSSFKVLSWLIPLYPIREIGIDHGSFAMIISSILEANNFWNKDFIFPRILDLSANSWFYTKNENYLLSNVPYHESLGKIIDIDSSYIVKVNDISHGSNIDIDIDNYSDLGFEHSNTVKDSYPIVIGSILVVLGLMLIEIIYLYIILFRKKESSTKDEKK